MSDEKRVVVHVDAWVPSASDRWAFTSVVTVTDETGRFASAVARTHTVFENASLSDKALERAVDAASVNLRAAQLESAGSTMPRDMSDERLAELRALSDAATPGPWGRDEIDFQYELNVLGRPSPNMAFCLTARTAIPELIDEIERLRECLSNIDGGYYAGLATQSE